ncbi:CGNR zinc finger domain-containing protein [Streptomyces canus]|uniref:CGNR zinc finger domain-containing protein n=1 Tax=Streptomyces canus TaxID=58343 RepID=UPI00369E16C9
MTTPTTRPARTPREPGRGGHRSMAQMPQAASVTEVADRCRAAGVVPDGPVTPRDLARTGEVWAAAAYPRMTNHVGTGRHLHYPRRGTAARRRAHRLRRCEVSECATIFADTTRTGRRRYCSHRCANRDAVRHHRARTASSD